MSFDKIYVGVDGGGTKTHLAASDASGKLLEFAESGPTNHQISKKAGENLIKLFSSVSNKIIETAVLALAGWDFERDRNILITNINHAIAKNEIIVNNLIIENDVFAVLKAGLGSAWQGVATISGTGVAGAAMNYDQYFRTFSYGYTSGEWGSGPDMAKYALYLVCAASQGRFDPFPVLTSSAFEFFGIDSIEELILHLDKLPRDSKKYGSFFPKVCKAYEMGCQGAEKVLTKGGTELARTAWAMLKKIKQTNVPIVLGGGVFQNFGVLPGFKETLMKLNNRIPEIRILESPPVYGALLWAAQAGNCSSDEFVNNIKVKVIE